MNGWEYRKWRNKLIIIILKKYGQKEIIENPIIKFIYFSLINKMNYTINEPVKTSSIKKWKNIYPDPGLDRIKISNISPNLIHSLDATHMQLIINQFLDFDKGGNRNDFFAIHDCFGAHPSDIDHLRKIIKETFFELYKNLDLKSLIEQIIINPKNKFGKQIKNKTHKQILDNIKESLGKLEIKDVKKAEYMIS